MVKSAREARVHTNWAFPNSDYEQAVVALVDGALSGARAGMFLQAFLPLARRVAAMGVHNSLIQAVVALTAPGVPDLYNGAELWDLSMVDPDNRRPVDYELRARLLAKLAEELKRDRALCMQELLRNWHDGRIKLAVIMSLLHHRRACPELYRSGDYQPLQIAGPRAEEVCSYVRSYKEQVVLVAVARFPRRRDEQGFDEETAVTLPAPLQRTPWRELLSGRTLVPGGPGLPARAVFSTLPAAVLVPDSTAAATAT